MRSRSGARSALERAVDELLEAVYPGRCRLCGAAAEDALACAEHALPARARGARCGVCAAALPAGLPDGYRCAACRRRPPGFRRVHVLGDWPSGRPGSRPGSRNGARDGTREARALREWVLALKHGGRRELARPLGLRLAARLRMDEEADEEAEAEAERARTRPPDVLVPVPLHPTRRVERGYDQALLLARAAGEAAGLAVRRALVRRRATAVQGASGGGSRAANVRGAFAPGGRVRERLARAARRAAPARAATRVWLVDDVVTSGATARECARALRTAGYRWVGVLALARAGEDPAE